MVMHRKSEIILIVYLCLMMFLILQFITCICFLIWQKMSFKAQLTKNCQTKEQTKLNYNYVKYQIQIRTTL